MPPTLEIFLNPAAGRGTADKAWNSLEPGLRRRFTDLCVHRCSSREMMIGRVRETFSRGGTHFIAAGGDGTIQTVLDALMEAPPRSPSFNLHLGAIALGTSNDFHKPLSKADRIEGVPVRIDPATPHPHDVFSIEITCPDGKTLTRFFLQSSHVGTIPSANFRLTGRPGFFNTAYRYWYWGSLMAVSAWEVFTYPGFRGKVEAGGKTWEGLFTGMSLVKRSHIAGQFFFMTERKTDDGLFDLAVCEKISPFRLISLIGEFEKKGLGGHPDVHFLETSQASVVFESPQPVDFDGEIIEAASARWKILPRAISILG